MWYIDVSHIRANAVKILGNAAQKNGTNTQKIKFKNTDKNLEGTQLMQEIVLVENEL